MDDRGEEGEAVLEENKTIHLLGRLSLIEMEPSESFKMITPHRVENSR